jgi:hypothetical protein
MHVTVGGRNTKLVTMTGSLEASAVSVSFFQERIDQEGNSTTLF